MALRHYKLDWISSGKSSEIFTMAKSVDTMSAKSSKESAKAITRPFKKFKQSLSSCSATRSTTSHSSSAILPSDHEANGDHANSVADNQSAHSGSEPEVELMPEQELGSSLI